ncbi:MAG: hypothetical protein U0228_07450 [Myxococcaceae bacterium]
MRVLAVVCLMLGCSAPVKPSMDASVEDPMDASVEVDSAVPATGCTLVEVVPFIAPFGQPNTRQTLTFHFRANMTCQTGSRDPTTDVVLTTPSNDVLALESVETGRLTEKWLNEYNVFVVKVVVTLPDVPVVRATFHLEGQELTRDVQLITPPDQLTAISWSPGHGPTVPPPRLPMWQLGPTEWLEVWDLTPIANYVWDSTRTEFSSWWQLRQPRPMYLAFAATSQFVFAAGLLVDRTQHLAVGPQGGPSLAAASLGDDLFVLTNQSELQVLDPDAGAFTTLTTLAFTGAVISMVGDGDQLLLGAEFPDNPAANFVEFRPRAALDQPGPRLGFPGKLFTVGTDRLWGTDFAEVISIRGDGGVQAVPHPSAGTMVYRSTVGPTRPGFVIPRVLGAEKPFDEGPYLWLPQPQRDGGLGHVWVQVSTANVAVNDQGLFELDRYARFPAP